MDADVIVVGAGHNGLVAASYLARAGLQVEIFEARPFVGGAAITEELWPGCFFSTCAHMVHALHPKIVRDLRLRELGLDVIPRSFYAHMLLDGTYYGPEDHDSPRNRASPSNVSASDRSATERYAAFKETLRSIFAPDRLRVPPGLAEVRARVAGTAAAAVLEQALISRVSSLHDEFLPSTQLKDQFAAETAAIGRDPLALSLAYASIDEPDPTTGERPAQGYVRGGTGTLSRLLGVAAESAGVRVHVERPVKRFIVDNDQVLGVRLADGTEVRSRTVVSNLDPKRTFLKLTEPEALTVDFRRRVEGLVTTVSCLKLLAVVTELPDWTAWDGDSALPSAGLVGLTRSRAEVAAAYDDLDAGRPPRAPTINFSVPSVLDSSLSSTGIHTASIWIYPAPSRLRKGTWDDARERVAEGLIDQMTGYAPNFRRSIRDYRLRTPLDFERENGLTDGCIWHVQHAGEALFWNRPLPELAAYRAPLQRLYLCGAGQHPGGEISGIPGHNAAYEILRDLERKSA